MRHFCYQLGRELHMDVDVIANWPLDKIHEYMAFYLTETDNFKEEYADSKLTDEQRHKQMMAKLGVR